MDINIAEYNFSEQKVDFDSIDYIELPAICPHCNNTGIQEFVTGALVEDNTESRNGYFPEPIFVIQKFNIITCCFFCKMYSTNIITHQFNTVNKLSTQSIEFTYPKYEQINNEPPQNIKDEYPDFYNIWKEATKAKNSGLHNLAGMGYRKSIEFLTTDYLLKNPIEGVETNWITNPKTTLKKKIDKLDKPRLVTLGKAIAYLGNDETHYTRIHEDYSIDDLINFIDLFISEIERDLKYKKAEELVNRPKK